jgi:pimeloyl-ACP methyl ester carboxylesterase
MWVRLCAVAVALLLPTPWSEAQLLRVQEERFVTVGGIEQWVTIRGDDRSNPVLLILHGGPGEAQSPLASVYAPLERNFVVVQWDQRGGGRTRARASGSAQSASLERLVEDGIELTEYIRGYLRTSNVLLVGHSWGSFLGVHIAKRRPELFRGFVGTGQVVSWRGIVEAQYRYTLDRARADSNAPAVRELEALGVPDFDKFDEYLVMRRWLNNYLAAADTRWLTNQDELVRAALTTEDLAAYRQGFQTMAGMTATVFSMDVRSLGLDFKLPFLMLQGAEDHITPTAAAERYFSEITAPFKRIVLLHGAGHFALMTHTAQFAVALSENLPPLR